MLGPATWPAIAFMACGAPVQSVTADRTEFLGEHGSISMPAALKRVGLSGRAGPALDPCAAMTAGTGACSGGDARSGFCLGSGREPGGGLDFNSINKYTQSGQAAQALTKGAEATGLDLEALQVKMPHRIDLMSQPFGRVYQVSACWASCCSASPPVWRSVRVRDQLQEMGHRPWVQRSGRGAGGDLASGGTTIRGGGC